MRELNFDVDEKFENFFVLGGAYAFVYLIRDNINILIDTGTAFWGKKIVHALKELGINELDIILLTHSHYDHVGGMPILLDKFNVKRIFAHTHMKKVLKSSRALKLINELNKKELRILSGEENYEFKPFEITDEAEEGKVVKTENFEVIIYETPGHTRDSISYLIKPINVLITGEAVGVPNKDDSWIFPQFLSSYEDYMKSMEKLEKLEVEILGLPHEHIIEGKENVRTFFENSKRITVEYAQDIMKTIEQYGNNLEVIIEKLIEKYYEPKGARQPIYAFKENLKAQVLKLLKGGSYV